MKKKITKPFELLLDYEQKSLQHAVKLPEQQEHGNAWSGIGFRLNEHFYVLPVDRVVEVLMPAEALPVPGIKSWVIGLANLRGTLMPIIDLKRYLTTIPTQITGRSRLMVVNQPGGQVALLVDEVFGQRHFQPEDNCDTDLPEDSGFARYSSTAFGQEGRTWNLFDVDRLVNDTDFQNAAVA